MGDPYLSSDESLILSTHNIRVDSVSLDLMLTSRRLILIDNAVTPFQLRTIPLETIITVVAGMNVKGEPIFTLSHMDPSGTGAPQPKDFIFIQQKGEARAQECREWAATLTDHAGMARNGALSAGTLPYDPVKFLQPRMSATYRIETSGPRKPAAMEYPLMAEPARFPDPQISPEENGIPAGTDEYALPESGEMVKTADSSVVVSHEPEATGETDADLSRADTFPPPPAIPEDLIESPAPAAPEAEHSTEVSPEDEQPSDLTNGRIGDDIPGEEIPGTEKPVSLQAGELTKNDEPPAITDAERIWADAARSAVSSPPPVPVIPGETLPVAGQSGVTSTAEPDPAGNVPEEPVAGIKEESPPVDAIMPASPADEEAAEQPAPPAPPVPAAVSSPAPETQKRSSPALLTVAVVAIILAVLGGAVIGLFFLPGSGEIPAPAVVPVVTVQPTPSPLPSPVPADGVWVRIDYPGTFIGEVGNPGLMHPVSGSGVQIYKILWSDRIVKASVQKQENSGDTLLVEVYSNGTLLKRSSTRVPMGSVDILIDPATGQPPGIRPGDIP
jgi:hypothetical protein